MFWEFLEAKQLDWTKIKLSNLAAFVGWLRELQNDSAIIDITITPKFISQDVLIQLKRHLHCLSDWMQRFILVLLETGRRVSEVSFLKFDCLEQDSDGDWLLRVSEKN